MSGPIRILVLVIVMGLVAWLLTFLPIPAPFPQIIYVMMILVVVWEILALFGYVGSFLNRGNHNP